jgi:hypothetical protein
MVNSNGVDRKTYGHYLLKRFLNSYMATAELTETFKDSHAAYPFIEIFLKP